MATLKPLMGNSLLTNVGAAHARSKEAVHRHVQRQSVQRNLEQMVAVTNQAVARIALAGGCETTAELPPLALHLGCTAMFGNELISTADRLAIVKAVWIVEAEIAADMFRMPPQWP